MQMPGTRRAVWSVSAIVALLALSHAAQADVTGPATVIDGDTLVIAGERVRLQGIDAPELHQTCTAYGQEWPCGRTASDWLKAFLAGRTIECRVRLGAGCSSPARTRASRRC